MHEKFRAWFGALVLLLAAGFAYAQGQPQAPVQAAVDLYAAVVPVAEQSNAELKRGAGLGLREVLVRVSGSSDTARSAALSGALGDAGRYLDQYRYERNAGAEPGAAPWLLQLRFAPNSIAQLLRGAGLPVWAGNRPALQLWLVLDEGGRRRFVDEQSPLAAPLRAQARRRGLALHFPQDVRAASVDAVWQLNGAGLRTGAAGGEVAVLGRIAQLPGGRWSGAWVLAGSEPAPQSEGENLDAYLAPGFDRIADALAQQYAVTAAATTAGGATLRVAGVDSFNAYAALLAYLKQIGAIKAANLLQVQGDTVVLQLKLESSAEQLARQLALDNRLATEAVDAAQPTVLNYRWQAGRG
jgi:hypothetical protein